MVAIMFTGFIIANMLLAGIGFIHTLPYLLLTLIIGGFAGGIGMAAMQNASLQSVQKEMAGTASGIYSTFRYVGSTIASGLIGLLAGFTSTFMLMVAISILGIWISQWIEKNYHFTKHLTR